MESLVFKRERWWKKVKDKRILKRKNISVCMYICRNIVFYNFCKKCYLENSLICFIYVYYIYNNTYIYIIYDIYNIYIYIVILSPSHVLIDDSLTWRNVHKYIEEEVSNWISSLIELRFIGSIVNISHFTESPLKAIRLVE